MHDQQLIVATGILYHNTDTYTAATTDAINYRHNCIGKNIDEELAGSSTREIAAASQNPTAIIPTTGVSSRNVALGCVAVSEYLDKRFGRWYDYISYDT